MPLGVVTAIAGQTGATVTFSGMAGHAGTVPMSLRRDALTAAAEWILDVEALARETDGLVATVGELSLEPGVGNVIPGRVELHPRSAPRRRSVPDASRRRFGDAPSDRRARGGGGRVESHARRRGQPLAGAERAAGRGGRGVRSTRSVRLPSGAGHDAAILSTITPAAMLFVRCAGGVSHNPAESVTVEDVAAAIDVTTRFLELLA